MRILCLCILLSNLPDQQLTLVNAFSSQTHQAQSRRWGGSHSWTISKGADHNADSQAGGLFFFFFFEKRTEFIRVGDAIRTTGQLKRELTPFKG